MSKPPKVPHPWDRFEAERVAYEASPHPRKRKVQAEPAAAFTEEEIPKAHLTEPFRLPR